MYHQLFLKKTRGYFTQDINQEKRENECLNIRNFDEILSRHFLGEKDILNTTLNNC